MLVNIPIDLDFDPCRNSIQKENKQNIKTSILMEQKNFDSEEINQLVKCIYKNIGEE